MKTEGVRGLYRGFGASIVTLVPGSALWWGAYGTYQRIGWGLVPEAYGGGGGGGGGRGDDGSDFASTSGVTAVVNSEPSDAVAMGVQIASGVCAGMTSGFFTTPLDVVKTRVQIRDVPTQDFAGGVRGGGGGGAGGNRGVLAELLAIARAGGAKDLFAGPTCGIVLVAYEMAKSM